MTKKTKYNRKKQGDGIVSNTINKILPTRNNFPPAVRNIIQKFGDRQITGIQIGRTPINSAIKKVINLLSAGKFEQNIKNLKYDDVFHLFMVVSLDNGVSLVIEKNEVVNMKQVDGSYIRRAKDVISIPFGIKSTFANFIDRAVKTVGPSIYLYNYKTNNCQVFIRNLLRANGLLNSQAETFIMQDAEKLLSKTPAFLDTIANTATEIAAKANRLVHGAGNRKKRKTPPKVNALDF